MPRTSPVLTNFTAGEWSPKLYGRIDLAQYPNACKAMCNFVVLLHGGAQRRPGTYFIAETKDSEAGLDKKARLIPFRYSTDQAYVLEIGEGYTRFYKDGGQIINDADNPVELANVYAESDLSDLRYIQDKDLMYFFHQAYQPTKLTRTSHTDWLQNLVFFTNGPYAPSAAAAAAAADLITNGDMELDGNWTTVGTPLLRERTNERKYEGNYSQKVIAENPGEGFRSDLFTTETDATYRLRFRIFTAAETFKLRVHEGNDSGSYVVDETFSGVPTNEWTEYNRYYRETAGGDGAYVEFLAEMAANIIAYETNYPPAYSSEYVKATTQESTQFHPHFAVSHASLLTGSDVGNSWRSAHGAITNQHFHIDLGESVLVRRIYYENFHNNGSNRMRGVNAFTLWGSNDPDSFANMASLDGWTEISCASNTFDIHVGANTPDPKYISCVTTKKYRYYKFIFANNHGDGSHMGIRRIGLQEGEYETAPDVFVDKVECSQMEINTISPSAITGQGITLTTSSGFFLAGHIGALVEITHDEITGNARIVNVISPTEAVADVIEPFGDTIAVPDWRISAWSDENGWPACACFYEQRLIAASTPTDPDGVWGSRPTAYEDFTDGVLATDAFAYKLQSDIVRWVASMGSLIVGTVDSEYVVGSINDASALNATSVKMTRKKRKGSANIEPINLGDSMLFVQRQGDPNNYGKSIREFTYNYDPETGVAGFLAYNLTLFAEHITGRGIVEMAFMSAPYPILWALTVDGEVIGMSYEREQKIIAFHRHPTAGFVESICVIPGEIQDDLWLIVNRGVINGSTRRYIEVMADFDFGNLEDSFFVDCGLTYEGEATTMIAGLDHLEGRTVAGLADGRVITRREVVNGQITLGTPAEKVHIGLPIDDCCLQTMELEGGSLEGAAAGKQKKLHNVALRLYQTVGGVIGTTGNNLEYIRYPKGTTGMFTGITEDTCALGAWDKEQTVIIQQPDPLPMTVLTIMPRYRTEDK